MRPVARLGVAGDDKVHSHNITQPDAVGIRGAAAARNTDWLGAKHSGEWWCSAM